MFVKIAATKTLRYTHYKCKIAWQINYFALFVDRSRKLDQ